MAAMGWRAVMDWKLAHTSGGRNLSRDLEGMRARLRNQLPSICIDLGQMGSEGVGVRWQREHLATGLPGIARRATTADSAFGGGIHSKAAWRPASSAELRYRFPPLPNICLFHCSS